MQTHANGCALTTMIILLLSVCSLNELGLTFCDILLESGETSDEGKVVYLARTSFQAAGKSTASGSRSLAGTVCSQSRRALTISSAAAPACRSVVVGPLYQSISASNCAGPSRNSLTFPVLDIDPLFDAAAAVEVVPVWRCGR